MILYHYTFAYVDCIDTHLDCIDISNIVIYQCISIKMYTYSLIHTTDAIVVHYGCEFTSFQLFIGLKSSKNQLIHT